MPFPLRQRYVQLTSFGPEKLFGGFPFWALNEFACVCVCGIGKRVGGCVCWGSNKVHTLMYFTLGWTSFKVDKGGLLDEVVGEGQGLQLPGQIKRAIKAY